MIVFMLSLSALLPILLLVVHNCKLQGEREALRKRIAGLEDMLGTGDERARREIAATVRERAKVMAKTADWLKPVEDFLASANRIERGS